MHTVCGRGRAIQFPALLAAHHCFLPVEIETSPLLVTFQTRRAHSSYWCKRALWYLQSNQRPAWVKRKVTPLSMHFFAICHRSLRQGVGLWNFLKKVALSKDLFVKILYATRTLYGYSNYFGRQSWIDFFPIYISFTSWHAWIWDLILKCFLFGTG